MHEIVFTTFYGLYLNLLNNQNNDQEHKGVCLLNLIRAQALKVGSLTSFNKTENFVNWLLGLGIIYFGISNGLAIVNQ